MVVFPRFSPARGVTPACLCVTGGPAHGQEDADVRHRAWARAPSSSPPPRRQSPADTSLPRPVSDTVIEFNGLTVVQVSQNQAAVVSDPQNHVFVIKNSGFVAYAIEGTYNVLSIVDQTHLPTKIQDRITGVVLGWCVTAREFPHGCREAVAQQQPGF